MRGKIESRPYLRIYVSAHMYVSPAICMHTADSAHVNGRMLVSLKTSWRLWTCRCVARISWPAGGCGGAT